MRAALGRTAHPLFRIHLRCIDRLIAVADRCKQKEDAFNEVSALRAAASLAMKSVEIHQGKRVSMDVNLRSQEDVVKWDDLPPEVQKSYDAMMEVLQQHKAPVPWAE